MPVVEQQGQGPVAFVLIHGTPGDSFHLAPLASRLSGHGSVLSLDLPDHGRAPDQSSLDPDTSLSDLRAVVDALAPRQTLLAGFSYGAYLAARLLSQAPGHVRGAALFAGFATLSEEDAALRRSLAQQLDTGMLTAEGLAEAAAGLFLGSETCPEAALRIRASIAATPLPRLSRALKRAAACARADRRVAPFGLPARIVHGRSDGVVAFAHAQALAELGSTPLDILETDAHLLPWTHTEQCAAAVLALAGPCS